MSLFGTDEEETPSPPLARQKWGIELNTAEGIGSQGVNNNQDIRTVECDRLRFENSMAKFYNDLDLIAAFHVSFIISMRKLS